MADADGITNRGAYRILEAIFRNTWSAGEPTNFKLMLIQDAAFDPDWNTVSDLTTGEVADGNGYTTGGQSVARNDTDFDTLTEADASDWSLIQLKNYAWTASGGAISNIKGAILTDDNATIADREIWAYWDVVDATVNDGAIYQLEDLEIKMDTVA